MSEFGSRGYLLAGDKEAGLKKGLEIAAEFLSCGTGELKSHLDFTFLKNSLFSVEDAREIRALSTKKSFSGLGRIFLIQADFWSREASNALLKTFEEPAGLSSFILATSSEENILPTLRSRLTVLKISTPKAIPQAKREFIKKFLAAGVSKRMKIIESFSDDKEKTADFLNGLEAVLGAAAPENFMDKDFMFSLEEIEKCRRLIFTRSPSLKLILEHLCLVIKKI